MITFQLINSLLRFFRALDLEVFLDGANRECIYATSSYKRTFDGWTVTRTLFISPLSSNELFIHVKLETFGFYKDGEFGDIIHEYTTNNLHKAIKKAYIYMQDEKEVLAIK